MMKRASSSTAGGAVSSPTTQNAKRQMLGGSTSTSSGAGSSRIGIHIFTRDFRLDDNRALAALAQKCDMILPMFVFTPEQTKESDYFSNHSFAFLLAALKDLKENYLKKVHSSDLFCFYGRHDVVLKELIEKFRASTTNVNVVSIVEDYTPYAKIREQKIRQTCADNNLELLVTEDHNVTNMARSSSTHKVKVLFWISSRLRFNERNDRLKNVFRIS